MPRPLKLENDFNKGIDGIPPLLPEIIARLKLEFVDSVICPGPRQKRADSAVGVSDGFADLLPAFAANPSGEKEGWAPPPPDDPD